MNDPLNARRWAGPEALLGASGASDPVIPRPDAAKPLEMQPGAKAGQNNGASAVPLGKAMALFEIDPLARLAYEGRNTGLNDPSDSGQDLSLATRAALAGWKAGEILALLGQARRERNADEKHPGYFQLTVEKALAAAERQRIDGRVAEEFGFPDGTVVKHLALEERLRLISNALGLEPAITRVTKTLAEPVTYRLHWNNHAVTLGTSTGLLDQGTFRARMLDMAGKVVPRMKSERWDSLVQMIADVCEVQEVGEEGNLLGVLFGRLVTYMAEHVGTVKETANWQEMARANRPYRTPDGLFLSTQGQSGFVSYLLIQHNMKITTQQTATILRQLGWEYRAQSIRDGQGVFRRGLWKAPATWEQKSV